MKSCCSSFANVTLFTSDSIFFSLSFVGFAQHSETTTRVGWMDVADGGGDEGRVCLRGREKKLENKTERREKTSLNNNKPTAIDFSFKTRAMTY